MKHYLFFATLGLLLAVAGCSGTQQASEQTRKPITDTDALLKYQHKISVDFLKKHLSVFAADSMKGRETGMPGQKKAARYLARQYKKLGLQPAGDDSSYFQNFKLNATRTDSIVFKTYPSNNADGSSAQRSVASPNSTADFIQQFGRGDTLSGDIVFAGFGIQNMKAGINQLAGTNLQGKWVMIFSEVPQVVQGDTLYQNERSFTRTWLGTIFQKGVKGVLMISKKSPEKFNETAASKSKSFGEPSGMRLAYRPDRQGGRSIGLLSVNPTKAANLLGLENAAALRQRKKEIKQNMSGFKAKETGRGLTQINYESKVSLESENVLAYLEGADPRLKDEVVVLTSHYDHLGIGQPDSTGDRIYNGADDDGSGVIGMLNVAKAFAAAAEQGVRPRRSILFMHVSGEEKGLLGSRYYSDHPVFPIDKTVANINTDMIGRIDKAHEKKGVENYAYIIGAELISSELDSLVKAANRQTGQIELNKKYNDLQDPNQFYRRSDHWNFGRLGVPFVFFFTGVHEDYHRPSDEVHKIRFEKMANILRTMYGSAVLIANADEAPTVDNQAFIEITK